MLKNELMKEPKNKVYKIFIFYSSKDRELRAFFESELRNLKIGFWN